MKTAILLLAAIVLVSGSSFADDKPKKKPALKIGKRYLVVVNDGRVLVGTLAKLDKSSITIEDRLNKKSYAILRKTIEAIREAPAPTKTETAEAAAKRKLEEARRRRLAVQRQRLLIQRRGVNDSTVARGKVDPNDPAVRLLLLSPKGPLLANVAIYVDDKPFRTMRESVVDEVMQAGDTNKDGKRTWEELLKNPRVPLARFGTIAANPRSVQMYASRYDLNGNSLVERYEARRMVEQMGYGPPITIQPSQSYYAQPDVKRLLDTNGDGKLTKSELAVAAERLKSRDANDNDLVEAGELGGGRNNVVRGVRLPTNGQSVYQIDEGASLASIFLVLQLRYGNKAKRIPRSAFQIAPKFFTELDLNGNGILDSGEVVGLHLAKPQLNVEVRIGTSTKQPSVRLSSKLDKTALKIAVEKIESRVVSLGMPGWKLRLNVPNVAPYRSNYGRTAQYYISRYDVDKNGYIDEKDVKKLGNLGATVKRQMKQWDVDADGKVYAKEIKTFYDRVYAPQRSRIAVSVADQGPSLFAALDVSGDNRLSLREMRTAGERLRSLDRNRNAVIDPDEMPGETVLTFTRGRVTYNQRQTSRNKRATSRGVRGPKWFVHMDKNGDGDITLREFLGTKSQFVKLDTNKDGFIEPKEAEAAGK